MNALVDSALRIYVPTILDAAGQGKVAERLRLVSPDYDDYMRACAILQLVQRTAQGPWQRILRNAAYWTAQAIATVYDGRDKAAELLIEQMQVDCDREMGQLILN